MGWCSSGDPLYVILPYFNFCGFKRRQTLFVDFVSKIEKKTGLKIVVVECAGPMPLPKLPVWKHIVVKSESVLWIKENLINKGASYLPKNWKYIAWIDADIQFLNERWVQDTIDELQTADIVQLWRTAVSLGPDGEVFKTDKSFAYMFVGSNTPWVQNDKYGFWHPGFAWACTRKTFMQMGGLLDWAILGSGDRHLAMALTGRALQSAPGNIHGNYKALLKELELLCKGLKVSWVDGTIVHQWHGSLEKRKYRERWDILTKNRFDPLTDIGFTKRDIIQLTSEGSRLKAPIEDYFMGRDEDSSSFL